MKIIKFIIKLILIIAILGATVKVGLIVFDGYTMYKDTLAEKSLDIRVIEVQSDDNFILLPQISDYFLDAIVAVEDKDFYSHGPISFKSLGRAIVTNVKNREFTEGGSTITQQVAKNLCFSMDKKLSRKVAEALVAIDLEKAYPKEDILELYVNIIYYGDNYTGIKAAANGYFGKIPLDLDLNESTLLAGLPQAPSVYALSSNMDKAKERRKEVVAAMVSTGVLTEEEANQIAD